jgi:hypothetical protein
MSCLESQVLHDRDQAEPAIPKEETKELTENVHSEQEDNWEKNERSQKKKWFLLSGYFLLEFPSNE